MKYNKIKTIIEESGNRAITQYFNDLGIELTLLNNKEVYVLSWKILSDVSFATEFDEQKNNDYVALNSLFVNKEYISQEQNRGVERTKIYFKNIKKTFNITHTSSIRRTRAHPNDLILA